MSSIYGLAVVAVGIVLVLVALHGAQGLELKPTPGAGVSTAGASGKSGLGADGSAGGGGGGGGGGSW